MNRYNPRQRRRWECSSESDGTEDTSYVDPNSLILPLDEGIGMKGKNYMVLHTTPVSIDQGSGHREELIQQKATVSFTSLLNSIGDPESFVQQGYAYLCQFLNNPQRVFWFLMVILVLLFFYPLTTTLVFGSLCIILIGGHQNEDSKSTTRTAKWTVTNLTQYLKDGFLNSPSFLDKCGQWRMVIKQKKGMDGIQTYFGLLCTDIFPEIELVTCNVTFFLTNILGQEVSSGGMRNLNFQHEYQCPGDCGFSRPIHISRRQLGESETITVHCTIEFRQKLVTFFKTVLRNFRSDRNDRSMMKKGKNVVTEHGTVLPGDLEFHEENTLPPAFRPVMRFVQHSETRTFIWEVPGFTSLMENSELWGVYSPQFFVMCHDVCSIWRMKLLEVQGVFRLHVQLRGLPNSLKQVKLWYLLQLVDMYGDSVIPEHAISRVKYPDHMNLWDTTRHILYRRETILQRFIGSDGGFCLRISLQMEPNDVSLMEVDSDEWIHSPNSNNNPAINSVMDTQSENIKMLEGPRGILKEFEQAKSKMLTN